MYPNSESTFVSSLKYGCLRGLMLNSLNSFPGWFLDLIVDSPQNRQYSLANWGRGSKQEEEFYLLLLWVIFSDEGETVGVGVSDCLYSPVLCLASLTEAFIVINI